MSVAGPGELELQWVQDLPRCIKAQEGGGDCCLCTSTGGMTHRGSSSLRTG